MKRLPLLVCAILSCLLLPVPSFAGAEEMSRNGSENSYKPIGEWTGRLLLPKHDQRDPAGGVPFKVENSPLPELVGRILWVRWDTTKPWDQWFQKLRFDLSIDPRRLAKAMEDGTTEGVLGL